MERIKRKLELIKSLKKEGIDDLPSFESFDDGSGSIHIKDSTYFHPDFVEKLYLWCKKNGCSFGIIGSAQGDIQPGWVRLEIYPQAFGE